MEPELYSRIPFNVQVMLVELEKVHEIAEWCGGKVGMGPIKILGVDTMLPCVILDRPEGGKPYTAMIGYYIVKHDKKFRVFRPASFLSMYQRASTIPTFKVGERVQVTSEYRTECGHIGDVKRANSKMIVVDFPDYQTYGKKYHPEELKIIPTIEIRPESDDVPLYAENDKVEIVDPKHSKSGSIGVVTDVSMEEDKHLYIVHFSDFGASNDFDRFHDYQLASYHAPAAIDATQEV